MSETHEIGQSIEEQKHYVENYVLTGKAVVTAMELLELTEALEAVGIVGGALSPVVMLVHTFTSLAAGVEHKQAVARAVGFSYGAICAVAESQSFPAHDTTWFAGGAGEYAEDFDAGLQSGYAAAYADVRLLNGARIRLVQGEDAAVLLNEIWDAAVPIAFPDDEVLWGLLGTASNATTRASLQATTLTWPYVGHH